MENCTVGNDICAKSKNQCEYVNHEYVNDIDSHSDSPEEETTNNHVILSQKNDTENGSLEIKDVNESVGNAVIDNVESEDEENKKIPNVIIIKNSELCINNESCNNSAAVTNASLNDNGDNEDDCLTAVDHSDVITEISLDSMSENNRPSEVEVDETETTETTDRSTKGSSEPDGPKDPETKSVSNGVTSEITDENSLLLPSECPLKVTVLESEEPMEVDDDELSLNKSVSASESTACSQLHEDQSANSADAKGKISAQNETEGETLAQNEPEISLENSEISLQESTEPLNEIGDVEMASPEEASGNDVTCEANGDLTSAMDVDVNYDVGHDETDSSASAKLPDLSGGISSAEKETLPSETVSDAVVIEKDQNSPNPGDGKEIESLDGFEKEVNPEGETADVMSIKSDDDESRSEEVGEKDSCQEQNTEVVHVDQNEEDPDLGSADNEKDPFAQEAEASTSDGESTKTNDKEKEITTGAELSISLSDETEELQDAEKKGSNANDKKESGKTIESADSSNAEKNDDSCIIPDPAVNESVAVDKTEVKIGNKQIRKFDITPVRLEKLIDPSKLATRKVEPEDAKGIATSGRPQRQAAKKAETQIKEIVKQSDGESEESEQTAVCNRCSRLRSCRIIPATGVLACTENCYKILAEKKVQLPIRFVPAAKPVYAHKTSPSESKFPRKCAQCGLHNIVEDKALSWEALDFCNEECTDRYQKQHGSLCACCKNPVQHLSMGKYAVRFGLEARQFCSGNCLEEFKKSLKSCSYCQLDITKSTNTVVAKVGEKQMSLKEFCSQCCVDKYERMSSNQPPVPVVEDTCTVCTNKKLMEIRILVNGQTHPLCSDVCFRAFKFANNITDTDQCTTCKQFYHGTIPDSHFVFYEGSAYFFCSKVCMNVFILFRRKIVPCNWCKVKKYNFDMIKKSISGSNCLMMCSLNCLALFSASVNATSARKIKCDLCSNVAFPQYHLTMSDATIRNFCSYDCVVKFQTQYSKAPLQTQDHNKPNVMSVPIPSCVKRTAISPKPALTTVNAGVSKPSVSVANGLLPTASTSVKISHPLTVSANTTNLSPLISTVAGVQVQTQNKYIQQIIVKPPEPKEWQNKFTQCRPSMITKSVSCRPTLTAKETQTDEVLNHPAVLPIPVPIYVPVPMHMFTTPYPVPVPFPVPIPVPIFIPTTQKTFKGVQTHMKEILDKTPSNPYEADLLLMAKIVASEDKTEETEEVTKDDSDDDVPLADTAADLSDSDTFADTENSVSNNFNDEMLQTVIKMATEQLSNTPTVDLEAELTPNTITPQTQIEENCVPTEVPEIPIEKPRTRKRTQKSSGETPNRKRTKPQTPLVVSEVDGQVTSNITQQPNDVDSPPLTDAQRPDANMCLKYTIGVRAWKQWLVTKNEQIEQAALAANKKAKTFPTNILKLTTDELNYLLCSFVKEVRKPNGLEYAPDTIYYLCLSIQQYLFENGRIDNIFSDSLYEPFTNALDDIAKKFSEVNDATQYIVTRVEEEHLWESKQLGAHSPHVLLATLMFFNTKYFNLATLEEHMQLSFSHIMKHWKRNPATPVGKPGSPAPNRNVVLRFYPPQAALDAPNSRKKKVYEQHENETDPLRCPVKLYEFYLSKCPESVKQRNDVFYLQPERSCVPDSPVWYSTMPLQKELLMKMLHRIRMIKEVNISLLAS